MFIERMKQNWLFVCVLSVVMVFTNFGWAEDKPVQKLEEKILPEDIVYAEIICDTKKDIYKIYPYRLIGNRLGNKEDSIQSLKREKKSNPKLKYFSKKNIGFFINGKLIHELKLEHECNLPSGIKIKTSIDFNKPFITNVEYESGTRYTQIDSPIAINITDHDKVLAHIQNIFQVHSLRFSKGNIGICHPYDDASSCRFRPITELHSQPLLSTGGWSLIIN